MTAGNVIKPMSMMMNPNHRQQSAAGVVLSTPIITTKKAPATASKKKSDPVSRYQSMQNQWKSSSFLKASDTK